MRRSPQVCLDNSSLSWSTRFRTALVLYGSAAVPPCAVLRDFGDLRRPPLSNSPIIRGSPQCFARKLDT